MMKKIRSLIGLLLIPIISFAQSGNKTINELQKQTQAIVTINKNNGIAEFVRFPENKALSLPGASVQEKVFSFLETYKGIFNIKSVTESFSVQNTKTDNYGFKHITLKQNHDGVLVYDGQLKFHFNANDKLMAINGNYIPNIKLNSVPVISQSQANTIALQAIEKQNLNNSGKTLKVNKSTLYLFQKGIERNYYTSRHLAYEVEVRNDADVREFIFVDAHSGEIVEQFTGMAHAVNRVVYEGNTSNIIWQEGDAFPGFLTQWQQNEVATSGHVYNFFNNAFGYVSYNGADATMKTVNNDPGIDCPNANWNGVTANYCDGTASDDVIGHEWGHAYTEYTSGLIYAWQSGAMNESFSDIWGETIDLINNYEDADDDVSLRTACYSSDRWVIGEDATSFGSTGLRDMWNPTCKGDPGKVTDGNYRCSDADSGGVHTNSGIPNHAYALVVDGGNYNGQSISGIGLTKAAHIFWRAQSEYLTATSDFEDLANALEASAIDLLGVNLEGLSTDAAVGTSGEVITQFDIDQLVKAILAVELRIVPEACGFVSILSPLSVGLCEASIGNRVFFEDWETGMGNWTVEQLPVNASTWESRDWTIKSNLPDNRGGKAVFGTDPIIGDCSGDLENGIIRLVSPVITMPDYQNGTFDMSFNHYVSTEANWDGGNIKYRVDGGFWNILPGSAFTVNPYNSYIEPASEGNDNPMQGQVAFTGADGGSNVGSWGTSVIDLSSIGVLANSSVQFRFEMGTDGCNGQEGWYIDEITIYNCSEVLAVPEFNNLDGFIQVYPNPSQGVYTLKKTSSINLKYAKVHDINGRLIRSINLEDMQSSRAINITDVSSGLYFLTVESETSKSVIKLMKQ